MNNLTFSNNWQKKKILTSKQYQIKAFDTVNNLVIKERQGRQIVLSDNTQLIEFMSCSYLGLDQDRRVVSALTDTASQCGVNFAVARTRMRVSSLVTLEELLNRIFQGYCVTFTSLHLVHIGMFPLLASGEMPSYPIKDNGPVFILDKTVHASIQINRGLMQQFGEVKLVDFNQPDLLEAQLHLAQLEKKTPIIISDSIGSMGGSISVKWVFLLADRYESYVYLDDAHGVSIYGKNGCGYVLRELGYFHPRLILAVSLSKAFGSHGASIVLPTKDDEDLVRRFATTYSFSNPLPSAVIDSAIAAANIHLTEEISILQDRLQAHVKFFDDLITPSLIKSRIINYKSSSPIRGVLIGDENRTIEVTNQLRQQKLAVTAAMYPTTPKGKAILRITLGADHHLHEIEALTVVLKQTC